MSTTERAGVVVGDWRYPSGLETIPGAEDSRGFKYLSWDVTSVRYLEAFVQTVYRNLSPQHHAPVVDFFVKNL